MQGWSFQIGEFLQFHIPHHNLGRVKDNGNSGHWAILAFEIQKRFQ